MHEGSKEAALDLYGYRKLKQTLLGLYRNVSEKTCIKRNGVDYFAFRKDVESSWSDNISLECFAVLYILFGIFPVVL